MKKLILILALIFCAVNVSAEKAHSYVEIRAADIAGYLLDQGIDIDKVREEFDTCIKDYTFKELFDVAMNTDSLACQVHTFVIIEGYKRDKSLFVEMALSNPLTSSLILKYILDRKDHFNLSKEIIDHINNRIFLFGV